MRTRVVVALVLALAFSSAALASSPAQHDRDVLRFFAHHPGLARTPAGQVALLRIKVRQLGEQVRSLQASRTPAGLRAALYRSDPCLAEIVERESAGTWDPTIDYGMGHGDVSGPYGLGQANPGTKMASFGADWRTNPRTQLRWAVSYAASTYGSTCKAWAHWRWAHAW